MEIAGITADDIVNGEGVCVSLWTQGCPHRCPGCHNPETWKQGNGIYINHQDLYEQIIELISRNGIERNFSILGGEPLAPYNIIQVADIICRVKKKYPKIKIFLWTGYTWEKILKLFNQSGELRQALDNIDVLIDGPYIEAERDVSLKWRGSRNQRIIDVQKSLTTMEVCIYGTGD